MSKVSIDAFPAEVMKILNKYGNDVTNCVSEVTQDVTKKGVSLVRASARGMGWKKYPSSWTYKMEGPRIARWGIIHSKKPGLPHLLEKGHALRQGGRTGAYVHIKPVEETIKEQMETEVRSRVSDI